MVRLNTVVCVPIFACRYSQMNSNKTVEVLKMETIHDGPPSIKMTVSSGVVWDGVVRTKIYQ